MRHDQKGAAPKYVCEDCKVDNCRACLDVLRAYRLDCTPLCMCRRQYHGQDVQRGVAAMWPAPLGTPRSSYADCITCPSCFSTSHNSTDIVEAYCANCRKWIWEMNL